MGFRRDREKPDVSAEVDFGSLVKGYADMRLMADDSASPFLVDDLVGDSITLWYGQSEIGKSRFVCGFIAAMLRGEPFLDRKPQYPIDRVMILCADAGGDREYSRRLLRPEWAALTETEARGLFTMPIPAMQGPEYWHGLRRVLDTVGPALVILDPLTRAINGDSNRSSPVAEFYAGVQALGYPTIVVAHSVQQARGERAPPGLSDPARALLDRVERPVASGDARRPDNRRNRFAESDRQRRASSGDHGETGAGVDGVQRGLGTDPGRGRGASPGPDRRAVGAAPGRRRMAG